MAFHESVLGRLVRSVFLLLIMLLGKTVDVWLIDFVAMLPYLSGEIILEKSGLQHGSFSGAPIFEHDNNSKI